MSDVAYIGRKVRSFESSPRFSEYSRVVITVTDELEYAAGNETGRTLTLSCPWGTQEMAQNILARIRGFAYQPFSAADAHLDPAAELGDAVTVSSVYSGIYSQDITFSNMFISAVSAPADEELDHEYPYVEAQERKIVRQLNSLSTEMNAQLKVQANQIAMEAALRRADSRTFKAELAVQAENISAMVSKTGGDPSSFGWILDAESWTIKANNSDILKATKDGLEITGRITATSGKIGGFTIESNYLTYNNQTWGGENTTGIYIGPEGIQLGKHFKVDSSGNLSAASGTFSGFVQAGNILYGTDAQGNSYGTLSGSALTVGTVYGGSGGAIAGGTISTYNTVGGIKTSLGYADFANGVFSGFNTASYINCSTFVATNVMKFKDRVLDTVSIKYLNENGEVRTMDVVGWKRQV